MKYNIFLVAGGTAGHVSPALATARALRQINPDGRIIFISDKRYSGYSLLEDSGYPVEKIDCAGLPNRFSLKYFTFMVKLGRGFFNSVRLIKKYSPSLVAGFGGYVSFPVILAARILGLPAIIHEQNIMPGRANRILSRFVPCVALSFRETAKYLNCPESKFVWTGNPVRKQTTRPTGKEAKSDLGLQPDRFTIMVMGGSQGCHRINELFLQSLSGMSRQVQSRLQVIHLTGQKEFDEIKAAYLSLTIKVYVSPFLRQMEKAYCASDLVICRAGASCLAELSYCGCAAILVPYPYAYSHQVENARYFAEQGAALMLEQSEFTSGKLKTLILDLMDHPDKLRILSVNMKNLSCPDAGQRLAAEMVGLMAKDTKK